MKKFVFEYNNNIVVITVGKTSNAKIANDRDEIVQTYTFSKQQFEFAQSGEKGMNKFFELDGTNCLDCPLSGNQRKVSGLKTKCYTHKLMQYSGFLSSLRSIKSISEYNILLRDEIVAACIGKYVRFGTYGEPSLLPLDMIEMMAAAAKTYTGYTHQWRKRNEFGKYFMASAHNSIDAQEARQLGYRSFICHDNSEILDAVQCPASKELSKTTCQLCGLCSGMSGKGRKDVKILLH